MKFKIFLWLISTFQAFFLSLYVLNTFDVSFKGILYLVATMIVSLITTINFVKNPIGAIRDLSAQMDRDILSVNNTTAIEKEGDEFEQDPEYWPEDEPYPFMKQASRNKRRKAERK